MNRPAFRQGESRGLETSGKQKAPNSQRAAKFFRRQAGWLFGLLLFPFAPVPAMLAEDRDEGQQAGGAKEFFSPADEFPGNPQGYKIIGKFKVSAFSNGGYFLQADSARGEKDAMRRFVPRDDSIESGQTYTFTRERPMVIVSKSFLGQYDVDLPDNLLTDQAVEQQARMVAHQQEVARRQQIQEEQERLAKIPAFARPLVERQKTAASSPAVPNSFPKLGGYGKLAWGADLETTVLLAEIDPGAIVDVADYHHEYRSEPADPQKRLRIHQRHLELIKGINQNTTFQMAGLQAVPDAGGVFGSGENKKVVYLLSDSRLYAVAFLYPSGIMGEPVKTLTEALKMKYGNCSVRSRKIDGRSWTSMNWKNEHGSVVLVLKPFVDFEMELRKAMLPGASAELAANNAEFQATYGKNMLTDAAQELSDAAMGAFQKMVEVYDQQIELGGLIYYNDGILSRAAEKTQSLEAAVIADQKNLEQEETRKRQKAASQLLDKI